MGEAVRRKVQVILTVHVNELGEWMSSLGPCSGDGRLRTDRSRWTTFIYDPTRDGFTDHGNPVGNDNGGMQCEANHRDQSNQKVVVTGK